MRGAQAPGRRESGCSRGFHKQTDTGPSCQHGGLPGALSLQFCPPSPGRAGGLGGRSLQEGRPAQTPATPCLAGRATSGAAAGGCPSSPEGPRSGPSPHTSSPASGVPTAPGPHRELGLAFSSLTPLVLVLSPSFPRAPSCLPFASHLSAAAPRVPDSLSSVRRGSASSEANPPPHVRLPVAPCPLRVSPWAPAVGGVSLKGPPTAHLCRDASSEQTKRGLHRGPLSPTEARGCLCLCSQPSAGTSPLARRAVGRPRPSSSRLWPRGGSEQGLPSSAPAHALPPVHPSPQGP